MVPLRQCKKTSVGVKFRNAPIPNVKPRLTYLDAAGNHGLVCNPGVKAMRATLLERALEVSFRRAGGNPARQPSTYSLLGEVFSKDDLSKLFPGKLSTPEADKRKLLAMEYLDIINELPRGHARTAKLGMLRERFPDASVADDGDAMFGSTSNFLVHQRVTSHVKYG